MIEVIVVLILAATVVVPVLFGIDSRDGRDSQERPHH
jgi:hypothetical protein